MILLNNHIGKRKNIKGTSVIIKRQNSAEKPKSLTLSRTNTYELYDILKNTIFPILEDKVNISDVLKFTFKLKKLSKDNELIKEIEEFEKTLEV